MFPRTLFRSEARAPRDSIPSADGSDLLERFEVVKMTDPLFEFRNLATRCRELAEESNIPEVRERNLKLAEILEQTVAEIESGDVLLAALEEVVRSLPCEPEAEELARSWEPLLRERH